MNSWVQVLMVHSRTQFAIWSMICWSLLVEISEGQLIEGINDPDEDCAWNDLYYPGLILSRRSERVFQLGGNEEHEKLEISVTLKKNQVRKKQWKWFILWSTNHRQETLISFFLILTLILNLRELYVLCFLSSFRWRSLGWEIKQTCPETYKSKW